jgi:hypothetical protein
MLKKKIWASFQRVIELFTQKFVTKLKKYGVGIRDPEINLFRIRDPGSGSRGQKALDPGSGSATLLFSFPFRFFSLFSSYLEVLLFLFLGHLFSLLPIQDNQRRAHVPFGPSNGEKLSLTASVSDPDPD